ncbi:universal stress protein [Pedococcus sp.]|jgi:nucleotide-binding universal stress UspA family protein|uniref:universal stress protein n=1 Tax=Pedococcus sp. TaxID=2860345 RepID=UPI002E0EDF63|nr:universal stress protein [Pedococcus sp.]
MRLAPRGSIVVGVDGSKQADRAVDWAAEEADRRRCRLHVIHANDIDWLVAATLISTDDGPSADEIVAAAVDRSRRAFPSVEVTGQPTTGSAAHDLVAVSAQARLLVLGAHGTTPFHLPLGSVPQAVAAHASCPVVVVHGHETMGPEPQRPVVVGVDGSASSLRAVDFAFDEAARRATRLVAVHSWWIEVVEGMVVTTPGSPQWQLAAERMHADVAESLAGHGERYPEVDVEMRLVNDHPVEALVSASGDAALLVVGSRGHGGFAGLLLGSVSRGAMTRSSCPVAVVPATARVE